MKKNVTPQIQGLERTTFKSFFISLIFVLIVAKIVDVIGASMGPKMAFAACIGILLLCIQGAALWEYKKATLAEAQMNKWFALSGELVFSGVLVGIITTYSGTFDWQTVACVLGIQYAMLAFVVWIVWDKVKPMPRVPATPPEPFITDTGGRIY